MRRRISTTTRSRTKQLRAEAPIPERFLWCRLRERQLSGFKFRRQHPVESYILDFYCASAKLAIELDGLSHDDRTAYDAERTRFLNSLGIRVIRFSNDEVLNHLDNVVHVIACELGLEP